MCIRDSYTTDAAGIIRVPGLDAGWYVVTVTRAPDGYTLSEVNQSQNVEITSDGTAQVRFQFGKTYGVQIRTSVSQTGTMVPGVEYKVTKLDGSVVGAYTSDKAGLAYVDLSLIHISQQGIQLARKVHQSDPHQ